MAELGMVVAIVTGVVLVIGVFFAIGYGIGRKSEERWITATTGIKAFLNELERAGYQPCFPSCSRTGCRSPQWCRTVAKLYESVGRRPTVRSDQVNRAEIEHGTKAVIS